MDIRHHYLSQLRKHAQDALAERGKVNVEAGYIDNDGVYHTSITLTTLDAVEYYTAWADDGGTAFLQTGVEYLPELPLLPRKKPWWN
jgi:hypothetical protein